LKKRFLLIVEKRAVRQSPSTMNTLAVVCFLAVVGSASCQIQCYNCNSTTAPACGDPFTGGSALQSSGQTCNAGACSKTSVTSGSSTIVTRSCVQGGSPAACISASLFGYGGGSACTCNSGNYCNAAQPSVVPSVLTAAATIVTVVALLVNLGA